METTSLEIFRITIRESHGMIFIKPLCDFFKIDSENQVVNIKNDPILVNCYGKNRDKSIFGDNYPRFSLPKKGFIRWIQIINPNLVSEDLRDKFIHYQALIFDYMYDSVETEEQAGADYKRLRELKFQYAEIGREIQRIEKSFNKYLENKFTQTSIEFTDNKTISEGAS
jgi:hypothetical protein